LRIAQTKRAALGRPFFLRIGAARGLLLTISALLACPAVAQQTDSMPANELQPYCGPRVWRTPGGGLVYYDPNLFVMKLEGTYRVGFCLPLFRPPFHKRLR
jgi:hypothetical protein